MTLVFHCTVYSFANALLRLSLSHSVKTISGSSDKMTTESDMVLGLSTDRPLCDVCWNIFDEAKRVRCLEDLRPDNSYFVHHHSRTSFQTSVKAGCYICCHYQRLSADHLPGEMQSQCPFTIYQTYCFGRESLESLARFLFIEPMLEPMHKSGLRYEEVAFTLLETQSALISPFWSLSG